MRSDTGRGRIPLEGVRGAGYLIAQIALSRRNCTPATPTLSDAEADTAVVPETVAPSAGADIATVGGVVSGGDEVPLTGVIMSVWISAWVKARL